VDHPGGALQVQSFGCHIGHDQVPWAVSERTVPEGAKDGLARQASGSNTCLLACAPGQTDTWKPLTDITHGIPASCENQRWSSIYK
jgi:hypothetical protein